MEPNRADATSGAATNVEGYDESCARLPKAKRPLSVTGTYSVTAIPKLPCRLMSRNPTSRSTSLRRLLGWVFDFQCSGIFIENDDSWRTALPECRFGLLKVFKG